jgi:hypothetical protein
MYQAGIKQITLYENKNVTFRFWDALNLSAITELACQGDIIVIENLQRPEFDIKLKFSKAGNVTQDFKVEFLLLGLTLDNYELLNQFKTSIYGWCFLVEFYDDTFKFYNTPVYCKQSEIKPHDEMSFKVEMLTAVATTQKYYEYTPGISGVPTYRWDTELLTWDSEIYSFDYEL